MEFFDGWHVLNASLNESDLTAPTQLVMYKLFYMFDARRFPENLLVSDRELMDVTNIKSTRSIVEARRRLKNVGLIDFTTCAGKPTTYRLGKHFGNTFETESKHLVNTSETPAANSNIRARTSPVTVPVTFGSGRGGGAGDEILKVWRTETGFALTGTNADELARLVESHGFDRVHAAIVKAVATKRTEFAKFEHVKAILKGGERDDAHNARVVSLYRRPASELPGDLRRGDARRTASPTVAGCTGNGRFDAQSPDTDWLYETLEGG